MRNKRSYDLAVDYRDTLAQDLDTTDDTQRYDVEEQDTDWDVTAEFDGVNVGDEPTGEAYDLHKTVKPNLVARRIRASYFTKEIDERVSKAIDAAREAREAYSLEIGKKEASADFRYADGTPIYDGDFIVYKDLEKNFTDDKLSVVETLDGFDIYNRGELFGHIKDQYTAEEFLLASDIEYRDIDGRPLYDDDSVEMSDHIMQREYDNLVIEKRGNGFVVYNNGEIFDYIKTDNDAKNYRLLIKE